MISNAARLAQFQLWRTGVDARTLDEIGLSTENISAAINGVLDELNQLKQQNAELVDSLELMKLYNELGGNYWDLVCVSYSHGDDSSCEWQVVGHYMSKPYNRVLGFTCDEDSPHKAIKHALETTKGSVYDYLYEFNGGEI